jgi:hypothetical protein
MKTFLNSSALAFTLCSLARCVVDGAAIPVRFDPRAIRGIHIRICISLMCGDRSQVAHTNSDSSTVPCLISNGTKPTREFTARIGEFSTSSTYSRESFQAKGVFSGGIVSEALMRVF